MWKAVYVGMEVLAVVGVVGAVAGIVVGKSLVGVEFLWVLQAMYVSLFWYSQPLTLPWLSLSGLSLSNGYTQPVDLLRSYDAQTLSHSPTRLLYPTTFTTVPGKYGASFVEFQYPIILFILFHLLSYAAWVLEDVKNVKVVIWAKFFNNFFLYDAGLLTCMFTIHSVGNQAFLIYYSWGKV